MTEPEATTKWEENYAKEEDASFCSCEYIVSLVLLFVLEYFFLYYHFNLLFSLVLTLSLCVSC